MPYSSCHWPELQLVALVNSLAQPFYFSYLSIAMLDSKMFETKLRPTNVVAIFGGPHSTMDSVLASHPSSNSSWQSSTAKNVAAILQ